VSSIFLVQTSSTPLGIRDPLCLGGHLGCAKWHTIPSMAVLLLSGLASHLLLRLVLKKTPKRGENVREYETITHLVEPILCNICVKHPRNICAKQPLLNS
jgi:hypothetical protein